MKQSVFIFDADGVLNNFVVVEPDDRIITHIAALLERKIFVGINTGRGYDWIEENIVRRVRHKLQDKDGLSGLFISSEMGGFSVEFVDGKEQKTPSAFSLTPEQIAHAQKVFEQHPEYGELMYWLEGKESMATFVKKHEVPMDYFHVAQKEFTAIMHDAFKGEHIKVANSNDAVDIVRPEAGKWAGAQLIYDWLRRVTDIPHDHFVCFGDSMVDYDMARFFAAQSHDTVFVFAGTKFDDADLDPNITVVRTDQPYCEGTYQYLQSLQS